MIRIRETKHKESIEKNVEHGLDSLQGTTPFDPPEVYDENKKLKFSEGEVPEFIKELMDDHCNAIREVEIFEKALITFRNQDFKLDESLNTCFSNFYKFFDQHFLLHNEKEEKLLFSLLNQKLIESGEHSKSEFPTTAIDVMEDDHIKFIQLGTISFNFFGLATRIEDEKSRRFICETGYQSARELLELIRLHIYREDFTLFPLASKLISESDFSVMNSQSPRYKVHSEQNCSHDC